MLVRRERLEDEDAVRAVVSAAFGDTAPDNERVEPIEVGLLERLRRDVGWLPRLSLVAVDLDDAVVGHVVATRAQVGDYPALGVGPVAVRPDRQRRGVGTALMHAVVAAAEAVDESLIGLLGDPGYYGRFGFRPASSVQIHPPDPSWGDYFQVRVLRPGRLLRGRFTYAEPFHSL